MSDGLHDITICPMQEQDLPEVLAIEDVSYPRPWSRTHFLDELASPHAFPLAAFDQDGRLIGYICPMLLLDEGHIYNVAVHPDCRGRRIGELLVQRVLGDCRLGGAEIVTLEVRTSNAAARSLYRRIGFSETGLRKRYYENGEDAILMEYRFDNEDRS
jgi:ribosomal-protein-alanine N-acetyltransferase